MMSAEKPSVPYAEPPPPYTSAPYAGGPPPVAAYPSPGHGPHVAAGRTIFQGPMHPPPPGGVPVFPMSGGGFKPPTAQHTVVLNAPVGAPGSLAGYDYRQNPNEYDYRQNPMPAMTVVNVTQCGPYPMQVTCPHCSAHVMSETSALPGLLTWLLSGGLFLLGCWAGCCLIPCCIPECQDIEHRCPNCKQHLGTFRRI